jgi:hypothetical protein
MNPSRDQGKAGAAPEPGSGEKPRCPICGKPRDPDYKPFCSKRCADVDLGRWLTGSYAIPVKEEEDEDGDGPPPGGQGGKPERDQDDV